METITNEKEQIEEIFTEETLHQRGNNELPKPPVLQDFSALVHPTAIPVIQTPSASTSGHINIPTENLPDIGNISGLPTIDTPPVKGTMTIDVSQSDIKPDERVMEIDVSEASETAIDVSEVFSETVSAATSAPVPQPSTPKPFKCNFCRTHNTFDTVAELDSHKAFYHRPPVTFEMPYKCHHCEQCFKIKPPWLKHMKEAHDKKPFICDEVDCNFSFRSLDLLKRHKKKHLESRLAPGQKIVEKPHICQDCGKGFSEKQYLKQHRIRMHERPIEYKCDQCDYESYCKKAFGRHKAVKHPKDPTIEYRCEQCNIKFASRSNLNTHLKRHGPTTVHCELCDYGTYDKVSLKIHVMQNHTFERPFKCDLCEFATTLKPRLNQHYQRVHGDKTQIFKCPECPYSTHLQKNLKIHAQCHTDYRPYCCEVCGKAFRRSGQLNEHRNIHTGEKPYKCEICGYATAASGNLSKHKKEKHSNIQKLNI